MLAEQHMSPTLKAFKVSGGRDDHAILVMAEKRSQAIVSAIGELDCEYRNARAVRAPEFDGGIPSWEDLVLHHGWYRECRHCSALVFGDDMNDGGLFDVDDEAWCRKCGPRREEILQDRVDEIAHEEALKTEYAALARAQWPFAKVEGVYVTWRRTTEVWFSQGYDRPPFKYRRFLPTLRESPVQRNPWPVGFKSPVVSLLVPGCRWAVTWEPKRDPHHVEVHPDDVDAWHSAKARTA